MTTILYGEISKVAKKLSEKELELIKEMCYNSPDDRIVVELNRIRRSMDIPEVVTRKQVAKARIKMGLKKTKGIRSIVIKKGEKDV